MMPRLPVVTLLFDGGLVKGLEQERESETPPVEFFEISSKVWHQVAHVEYFPRDQVTKKISC